MRAKPLNPPVQQIYKESVQRAAPAVQDGQRYFRYHSERCGAGFGRGTVFWCADGQLPVLVILLAKVNAALPAQKATALFGGLRRLGFRLSLAAISANASSTKFPLKTTI